MAAKPTKKTTGARKPAKTSAGAGSRTRARSSRSAARPPAPVENLARVEPLPGEKAETRKLARVEPLPGETETRKLARFES